MDTLISILLYMNVISPSGNYTIGQINDFASFYSTQINTIKINPVQLEAVLAEEEPLAIWVIDSLGG